MMSVYVPRFEASRRPWDLSYRPAKQLKQGSQPVILHRVLLRYVPTTFQPTNGVRSSSVRAATLLAFFPQLRLIKMLRSSGYLNTFESHSFYEANKGNNRTNHIYDERFCDGT